MATSKITDSSGHEEVFNDAMLESEGSSGEASQPEDGLETLPTAPRAQPDNQDGTGDDVGSERAAAEVFLDPYYASYHDDRPASARNLPSLEVIIGPDNRTRINPTTSYPWRAICALKIRSRTGKNYIGTGWFISPRTVMTAGHCVFLHDEGGWAQHIEVIPGRNDASSPYGSAVSSSFRSVTGWTSSRNRDFDYGCIILPTNKRLGATTGFFGFANRNDATLLSKTLNLSGYPGDKGGNQQWFHALPPKSLTARTIVYNIDTFGGQSGSPVWYLESGNRYAVGVHTNGASSGNSATRIVTDVYNNMLSWKALGA